MQIHYLDPSKKTGFEGFMNYKLSKSDGDNGDESNGGNHGDGCLAYIFMGIILILLSIIFQ